jgi:hypothetical protein
LGISVDDYNCKVYEGHSADGCPALRHRSD